MFDFDFDSLNDDGFGPPEFDKIDRQEDAPRDRNAVVVRVDLDLCESTGVCRQVCPEDVFDDGDGPPKVLKPEACTECWICVENCVSGAIDIG